MSSLDFGFPKISGNIIKRTKLLIILLNMFFELFSSIKKITKYTVLSDEIYPFVSGMESLEENNTFRKNKIFQT
jgi:hypothetical protein